MEYYIILGIVSCMIGLLVGIMPGIGPFMAMLIGYPWLMNLDPMGLVVFYVNMLIASQFSGSVTAIVHGIPGEDTSFVASRVGFNYSTRGYGYYALAITSLGSALASVVAVVIMFSALDLFKYHTVFYSSKIQASILALVYVVLLLTERKIMSGISQILVASALAMVGYNEIFTTNITFGQSILVEGVSWLPVVLAVMVVPMLYNELWSTAPRTQKFESVIPVMEVLTRFKSHLATWRRSSLQGAVMGLIPGVGTTIVSSAVYFFEKRKTNHPAKQLIAAESSNNSAVVASLLPLLTFGIPITASETILVDLLQSKHTVIFMEWFVGAAVPGWGISRLSLIGIGLIITSLLAMIFTWQWVRVLIKSYRIGNKNLFMILITILMMTMLYQSYNSHKMILDIMTFLFLLPLGWLWKGRNVMIFLLSFIMFDNSSRIFWNVYQLYF